MNNVTANNIVNEMSIKQRHTLYYIIGYALDTGKDFTQVDTIDPYEIMFKDIYEAFTDDQKAVAAYMLNEVMPNREEED
jgi:hypothetical protein